MLEENEDTQASVPAGSEPDGDTPAQGRNRPRRAATRPAGPPPTLANPFLGESSGPQTQSAGPAAGAGPTAPAPRASPFAAVFQTPQIPSGAEPAQRSDPQRPRRPGGESQPESPDQSVEEAEQTPGGQRRSRRRGRGSGAQSASAKRAADAGETASDEQEPAAAHEPGAAPGGGPDIGAAQQGQSDQPDQQGDSEGSGATLQGGEQPPATKKRRRRRRGAASDAEVDGDDPNTVTKTRAPREAPPEQRVTGVKGSTRLEAKKQRRREGREAGRRRAPILSEAEFLARREAVDRTMVVRQSEEITQIAVLEDGVLVEHYVAQDVGAPVTMVGSIYLGRVQTVLPSMEAAFIDIGRGRNAVLYAGEVNWDAATLDGQPKRIEFALKSGDPVLVQVTKDPIGHKGARLTSQISLPGRYLVYVPDGSMTGISRKLPDTERRRLRSILKACVPEGAGIIVRTAAEGASEEELTRDVARLANTWQELQRKATTASPPQLLHSEPDLAIRVARDIFNEDFTSLHVEGERVWRQISTYLEAVAPDLVDRTSRWNGTGDCFAHYRIDEQLMKALDRKVWLPSGGSLIIEHTEAMTVIDVNTGRFTGQGGDLEETITQNNLEAAEEIVRQVRLRDIGGIIVIDFIDMVLESNRDLVLRRLVECLGRDRTKHQVTEITSLGLAQMTRKRIGAGLLETFSEPCEACQGRGVRVHMDSHGAPVSGRRRAVKPSGAHDPVEIMMRAQQPDAVAEVAAAGEPDSAADGPAEDAVHVAEDEQVVSGGPQPEAGEAAPAADLETLKVEALDPDEVSVVGTGQSLPAGVGQPADGGQDESGTQARDAADQSNEWQEGRV